MSRYDDPDYLDYARERDQAADLARRQLSAVREGRNPREELPDEPERVRVGDEEGDDDE